MKIGTLLSAFLSIGLVGFGIVHHMQRTSPEVQQAQVLLEGYYLTAPASAKWHEKRLLKTEKGFVQTFFSLDAQNQFGVPIRGNLCVVYQIEGANVVWDKNAFVLEGCSPEDSQQLERHRDLNRWPANGGK